MTVRDIQIYKKWLLEKSCARDNRTLHHMTQTYQVHIHQHITYTQRESPDQSKSYLVWLHSIKVAQSSLDYSRLSRSHTATGYLKRSGQGLSGDNTSHQTDHSDRSRSPPRTLSSSRIYVSTEVGNRLSQMIRTGIIWR
jgi:hypothetical protein